MIHRFGGSRPALLELLPLPHALPTYNAVLTVPPLPLWTSFVDVPLRADSADWVLFVDLGSQVRVYCSGESIEAVEASGRFARAEALFVSFTRAYMREKSGLGALDSMSTRNIRCTDTRESQVSSSGLSIRSGSPASNQRRR